MQVKRFFIFLCLLLLFPIPAFAVDPGLDWKTIENQHLAVHYAEGYKTIAEALLARAEAAHLQLTKALNWQPKEKTHVILSDETDYANGISTPFYFNRTVIYLTPPTGVNTLEDFDDWLAMLIMHEYAHIVHLDKAAGSPEYLRNIFGRFFLLFPNLYQPSWVIEGLATLEETDTKRGIGRGQSTMFASMMRMEVANGVQPVSHVNLPVNTWPDGATRYLYGVYFMLFIRETYGEEELGNWIEEYSDNLLPFFINTNASQTLGKDITALWRDFEQWLQRKFQPQIEAIKARGIRIGNQLSADAYKTDTVRALATAEGDEIYYVRNSGYRQASLMRINTDGNTQELVELTGPANLDIHPQAGVLLTQFEYCNNYTIYKDIYLYDTNSDSLKRLTECGRYLSASWLPDGGGMIAVHNNAGRFELQLLDRNAQRLETLWQASDGEIIGQIDVSASGSKVLASVWRKESGWNIELFDVAGRRWDKITDDVSIAAFPQFDADDNVLFSMEAGGVYNLYRYYPDTGNRQQLSNVIGGAFQSSQGSRNGAIYYAGYTAEGYAIFRLDPDTQDIDQAELRHNTAGTNTTLDRHLHPVEYTVGDHKQSDYSALSNMYPRWWFPTFEFTEQRSEFGLTTAGSDALGIHNYAIAASYDSKLNVPAWSLAYFYADRFMLSATRLNEISLDANGNLDRISRREISSAVLAFPDRYLLKQSNLLFSVIVDKTSDETLATGAIPYQSFEDNRLGVAWLLNTSRLNPLSISDNDGMKLRLVAEDSDTLNSDYTGQVYTLDWRQYIRTGKESAFDFRFLQGWGTEQPHAFQLGGEGNNENVTSIIFAGDPGEAVFNRQKYALRGYPEGLPQLRGRRAQLLSAEWRFPLERTETGYMSPPVGLMQYFGDIFAETGRTYHDSPETWYSSAGFELNADINLFYYLTLRTRLGYAHGFDSNIGDDRVYLKIGSSF